MKRTTWIPAHRREELRHLVTRSHQVVTLAAITGALAGLFVALFDELVAERALDGLFRLEPWLIAILPGIGLLVALAARTYLGDNTTPATTDEYLRAFHEPGFQLDLRSFGARMTAATATLASGAPLGLEGPSLYAGATIGENLQQRLPRSFRGGDHRTLMVAGAAAGVSAIFKAPATGAVFALEVPYQDDLARRMLLPALVASATGYLTFVAFHGTAPRFPVEGTPAFDLRDLLGAAAVGVVAGIGARGFAKMLRTAKDIAARPRPVITAVGAGIVLALLYVVGRLITGESLTVGGGYQVIAWAAEPSRSIPALLAILVLRCLATSAAVAGGGVGGIFIPLVTAGALTGSVIGVAVGSADMMLFLVIGVAAFLGAGYRVPLAAVMFVAETTGRPSFIVPGLLAAVAAELVMGMSSVTKYQRAARL